MAYYGADITKPSNHPNGAVGTLATSPLILPNGATGTGGTALSAPAGLAVTGSFQALTQYLVGTAYTNGTPTLAATNWTNTRTTLLPYQTIDGTWRLRMNIWGSITSTTTVSMTMSGVLFQTGRQALAVNPGGGTPIAIYCYCDAFSGPTNSIFTNSPSAFIALSISGDVELTGKPTWAN